MGPAMAHIGLAFAVIVTALVLALGTGVAFFSPPAVTHVGTTLQTTGKTGSEEGLVLGASLNSTDISPGQAVGLRIWEQNPASVPVNISAANNWSYQGLALGPCGSLDFPFGFKVLQGYYTASSPGLGSAQAVQLYAPGIYMCPAILSVGSYAIAPDSTNATIGGFSSPEPRFSIALNETSQVRGEYMGSSTTESPLPSGTYTVVVGDEWGASMFLYFTVTSATSRESVLIPAGTTITVTSSLDCVASHFQLPFGADTSVLTGAFSAGGLGATLYIATQQQASNLTQGHPSQWVYETGPTNSTSFSVSLPQGSYVIWIEGANRNCGASISEPLEVLTQVNVTQAFALNPA